MTTTITRSRQKEYIISHPKTLNEALDLTKMVTSVMLSHILIDRKLFKDTKYNKVTFNGVPIKLIRCENNLEREFFFCVKSAMKDLAKKNLESLTLVVYSKEDANDIEEYSIRYKYETDDQINIELFQQDETFEFSNNQKDKNILKDSLMKMLKNEKEFINSVKPIPNDYLIKLRLTYYEDRLVSESKYLQWKQVKETLKDSCAKIKLGKTDAKFNCATFFARSTLIKNDTSQDEDIID